MRLALLIVVLCLTSAFVSTEGDCPKALLGVWEYRQAAGDGYDSEGERIVLSCNGDSMHGLYFGLEREGEHGLFYTLVEMTALKVSANGELSFTIAERDLFHERPKNLQEVTQKKVTPAGFTRDVLYLHGQVEEDTLHLTCTSKASSCPDSVMTFRKGRV